MKNSFLQPFNSFMVNNLIYCFSQELKCFVEKTVDGKKEVKYDFNYRLAHLLLWNYEKEVGVVWWDDSLLCFFV